MGNFTEHKQLDISDIQDLSNEAKKEIDNLVKSAEDVKIKATTIIQKEKKLTIKQPFVLAFTDNLCKLAALNITQNELKIITHILHVMEYGNLISISQSSIARALEMQKSNVSYNFKKLKEKGILVDIDGHVFMNSNLFSKGLSHHLSTEKREELKNSASDLHDGSKKIKLEKSI